LIAVPFAVAALSASGVSAQSAGSNPDISVIPSFIVCPGGAENCSYSEADGNIELQEVELAVQGYLNPYVRGDVFFAYHGGGFEVEEAYASFVRGLGPFQAKVGKYRVEWGSLNALHPHAYSWIFQPLVEERMFGEEGLNQIAALADYSFAAGSRGEVKLGFDVLRGDIAATEHSHEHGDEGSGGESALICVGPGCVDGACVPSAGECAIVPLPAAEEEPGAGPELAYHVRASWFDEFRPNHSVLVALDGLSGTIEPAIDRNVSWIGGSFKYRWRPNRYRAVNVFLSYLRSRTDLAGEVPAGTSCIGPDCSPEGICTGPLCEVIEVTEEVKAGSVTTSGWYAIADWQFAQRWNAGVKLDRSQGLEETDVVRRAEAFLNFRLMEESTLFRLLVRREDGDLLESAENTVALQFLFSLGPHRPHQF
jgi:hypothetical protein